MQQNKAKTFQYDRNNAFYMKKYAFASLFFLIILFHPMHGFAQTDEPIDSPSEENLNSIAELITRGNELVDAANYDEAMTYYDRALSLDHLNVDALFGKGVALDYLERLDEAISYYDKVLEINSEHINALYNKALALYHLERYDEAISYYDKVLEIDPADIDALYNKGLALDRLERLDEAILFYDKVLVLNPNDVDALYGKGFALDRLGKYSQAITYYDRVLAINPNDAVALDKKNLLAGKYDVNANLDLLLDNTLLVIVGVFVLLLISIIVIDLAAKRRHARKVQKTLQQTQPSEKNQYEGKEAEKNHDDEDWRGV